MKVCIDCKKSLDESMFYKRKGKLIAICKECYKARYSEGALARQRKLRSTPEGKEYFRLAAERYRSTEHGRQMTREASSKYQKKRVQNDEEWRTKHYDDSRARKQEKYHTDPEYRMKEVTKQHNKRAHKESAGIVTLEDWNLILEYFSYECAYCGSKSDITQDHVVALANGGKNIPRNIVPACKHCNSSKNACNMESWYRMQPYFSDVRLENILKYIEEEN